jgi:hypothetical protein
MRFARAALFGLVGAGAISLVSALLRLLGLPIHIELVLGTLTGLHGGAAAFGVGLAIHLAVGTAFGILYGFLFERVWNHGGAFTGLILGLLHGALFGMFFGLTPQFHPGMPWPIPDPGPYFANAGTLGVLAFFGMHLMYGAIVGGGYGHVASEHDWAPAETL